MNVDDMSSRHVARRWLWVTAAALVAGCSTAPPLRLHTLQPLTGDAASGTAAPVAQRVWISLSPVGIPASVDRPEWVVDQPDGTLRLLDQDRWASPLRSELRAALIEGLRERHGAVEPQRPDAAGSATVWRVVVDIDRLSSEPGAEARLDAAWSISPTGAPGRGVPPLTGASCRSVLHQPAGTDTASLAAGHRHNVQALADAIGRALSAAASGSLSGITGCDAAQTAATQGGPEH